MANLGSLSVTSCRIGSVPDLFNALTEELIIEVLKRLPLKEANRCKCVCKRWFDSVSAPHFARCYIRHRSSLTPSFSLFFQYTDTYNWKVQIRVVQLANDVENNPVLNSPGFSLSFLPPSSSSSQSSSQPVQFLASSNGLVLCSTSIVEQELYYVCNPLTMHWVALPPPPSCHYWARIGFICITPDFEKNEIISQFKVVRIQEYGAGLHLNLRVQIFSSETGEWTDNVIWRPKPVFRSGSRVHDSAVVCNGVMHWRYVYLNHIFAFDPYKKANEEFRTIALPKERFSEISYHDNFFGESQGHLRYAEFHQDTFRVWKLEDYNSGEWSLVHKFHRSEMVCEDPKLAKYTTRCSYRSLMQAFHPSEGDVVFLVLPGHILECNLRSRSLKSLCKLVHPAACAPQTIFPYVLPWWPIQFLNADRNAI